METTARKFDLEGAPRRMSLPRIRGRERRRFRRLTRTACGRRLRPLGRDHDCRTADISPGDVRIHAPILPAVGQRVVLYLEGLGRVTGNVARRGDGDCAIIFDFSAHKREKMAEALTIAINKDIGIETPKRPASDGSQLAQIQFESGVAYAGEILDFSLSGVTIRSTKPPPMIGEWVRIGNVYGRVARLIEGGFAVDFERTAPPAKAD